MGKNAYIITSAIEVDNSYPFDLYTHNSNNVRSGIPPYERFRQTIYTIKIVHTVDPTAKLYIVDATLNYQRYEGLFSHFPYVEYYPINKYDENVARLANRHPCKAHCELAITKSFVESRFQELKNNYDFIMKLSGRYSPIYQISELEKYKFLMSKSRSWGEIQYLINGNEELKILDLRDQGESELKYYSSAFYGFDSSLLDYFLNDLVVKMFDITRDTWGVSYEMLLYYFLNKTRNNNIKETNWKVIGHSGIGNVWSTA